MQWAHTSFVTRFVRPDLGYLADVVDGPSGDELLLRPNQVFAVSLPYPLLEGSRAQTVVDAGGRALLTGLGLRSLSPDDPAYRGQDGGDQSHCDASCHQGAVWTWLLGAYAEAHYRVYRDRTAALALAADRERPSRRWPWERLRDPGRRRAASACRLHCAGLGRG